MGHEEDTRLNRIEQKLDLLSDAFSKLAVVDARLADYISASSRLSIRIGELEKEQVEQSKTIVRVETSLGALTKISWSLGLCVGGLLLTAIGKVIGL